MSLRFSGEFFVLTKLQIVNFKRFTKTEIELGNPVVFIGPNNSGKTTALQALALWNIGLQRWMEKRGSTAPGKRPGVTINRWPAPITAPWQKNFAITITRTWGATGSANLELTMLSILLC